MKCPFRHIFFSLVMAPLMTGCVPGSTTASIESSFASGTSSATSSATSSTSSSPTGILSLSNSVITVSASAVLVGGTSTITLSTKDTAGFAMSSGGATVIFSSAGGTATATIGPTTDVGDGTYTSVFTGTGVGTALSISATIDAAAVTSTYPTVSVNNALAISPGSTTMSAFDASDVANTKTFTTTGGVTTPSYSVIAGTMPGGSYGSVTAGGVYTAPADGGTLTVRASDGTTNSDSSVRVSYSRKSIDFNKASLHAVSIGNVTISSGSFSFWMKPPSAAPSAPAQDQYLFSRVISGSPTSGGELRVIILKSGTGGGNDGKLNFRLKSAAGTNYNIYSSASVCNGNWQHVVLTFPNMKMYINGVDQGGSATSTVGMDAPDTMNFEMGRNNALWNATPTATPGYYDGSMDDVAIFNSQLDQTKVTEIYNNGLSANLNNLSFSAQLIHWWKMGDQDTSPTLTDSVGSWHGTFTFDTGGSNPTVATDSAQ